MHIAASLLSAVLLFDGARNAVSATTSKTAESVDTTPIVQEAVVGAPVEEVWSVFSTGAGYRKLGSAQAEVDLCVGGLIRSHYDPKGRLGDESTIENEILAFEPARMIAFRIHHPPKGFPFGEAWKHTWTVVSLTDLGDARTNVRIAMLGYADDPESQAMRRFFATGNEWTLAKLQASFGGPTAPASAEAHAARPLAPIVTEVVVGVPRDEVWRSWTTSAGWKAFFGADARIGTRPGEPFEILFDPNQPAGERGSEGCTVLSSIPGEMFSFTWNAPPKFARARAERTWVVVEFESLPGASTRLRLRHLGFDAQAAAHPDDARMWEEVRAYFAQAWPGVLQGIASHFVHPNSLPPSAVTAPTK